ncbi:MAG: hypothetical protein CMO44_02785 [Verrucomicrobiales bacterium]|nr:hypothetical protein [Verrucomicrobiales bacterium]
MSTNIRLHAKLAFFGEVFVLRAKDEERKTTHYNDTPGNIPYSSNENPVASNQRGVCDRVGTTCHIYFFCGGIQGTMYAYNQQ